MRPWPEPWCARRLPTTRAWPTPYGTGTTRGASTAAAALTAILWRPLLVEGLVGSGRLMRPRRLCNGFEPRPTALPICDRPSPGWRGGWPSSGDRPTRRARFTRLARRRLRPTARSTWPGCGSAHGRLLRRTGQRRHAVERLRRANDLYLALGAVPFVVRTEEELAACGLPREQAKRRSVLEMTSRESEVAHLVAQRHDEHRDCRRTVRHSQGGGVPPREYLCQARAQGPPAAARLLGRLPPAHTGLSRRAGDRPLGARPRGVGSDPDGWPATWRAIRGPSRVGTSPINRPSGCCRGRDSSPGAASVAASIWPV